MDRVADDGNIALCGAAAVNFVLALFRGGAVCVAVLSWNDVDTDTQRGFSFTKRMDIETFHPDDTHACKKYIIFTGFV